MQDKVSAAPVHPSASQHSIEALEAVYRALNGTCQVVFQIAQPHFDTQRRESTTSIRSKKLKVAV